MGRLAGKTSIVTGAGTGIGKAIALMYAREGANVVVANRNAETGQATVDEITAAGGHALFVRTDVSSEAEVEALMAATVAEFGTIDVLCNNHAVYGLDAREITDLTEAAWDTMMDINAKGVFFTCKHALRVMKAARTGAIVNISSIGALVKSPMSGYAASKAVVNSLTKSIAAQFGEYGIRANVICPSTIETDRRNEVAAESNYKNDFIAHTKADEAHGEVSIVSRVLPDFGEPDDIAYAAVFLASDEAAYMTGAVLPVDGGTTRTRGD